MRSKEWNAIVVAGCLSFGSLSRAQTAPQPIAEAGEVAPQGLVVAPTAPASLPPVPTPEAPRALFIQRDIAPVEAPGAVPAAPPAAPGTQYLRIQAMPPAGGQAGGYGRMPGVARGARDAWIGVAVSPVSAALAHQLRLEDGSGVVVESVFPNTPAQKAGLQQYDVIERINDTPVAGPEQFSAAVRSHRAGGKITLRVIREGESTEIRVKLSRKIVSSDQQYQPLSGQSQPNAQFNYQADTHPRLWVPRSPGGPMGVPYGQPGAGRSPGPQSWTPAPPEAGPNQPYPPFAPTPGAMPPQPLSQPGAPGAPGEHFSPPPAPFQPRMMPGQSSHGFFQADSRRQGASVQVCYENGRLTVTVYSPDGNMIMKGPVEALMNQPGLPSDARRILQRLRADRASSAAPAPRKEKPRDDDEDEDDDAPTPRR